MHFIDYTDGSSLLAACFKLLVVLSNLLFEICGSSLSLLHVVVVSGAAVCQMCQCRPGGYMHIFFFKSNLQTT